MNRELQVITWAIHNPAAANIQCSVMVPSDPTAPPWKDKYIRCAAQAEWATVAPAGEGQTGYILRAYCREHWAMYERSQPVTEWKD